MAGLKIYQIAYQNEDPKSKEFCTLRFAEVAACNVKEAKEMFFRNHHTCNRIVQVRFKRKENTK